MHTIPRLSLASPRICSRGESLLEQMPMSVDLVGTKAKAAMEYRYVISGCMGMVAMLPARVDARGHKQEKQLNPRRAV